VGTIAKYGVLWTLVVLLLLGACGPNVTPQDIQKLSDEQSVLLLECQGRKIYDDRGKEEADKYINQTIAEVLKSKQKDMTVQYALAEDGYYCDAEERAAIAKEIKREERYAQWGFPADVQDMRPGLFGGAFVDEVEYKIDSERTGFWMGISKNKELKVSTTADSEAEMLELARTLKEKESEGFDFTRAEYFGGKKDLDQQTYSINGTICILNSKDGLLLFGDQYPLGDAFEQATRDFEQGDGIVFVGSQE
jgi:hypothetical protein